MNRMLTVLAEGSPAGDAIRTNETLYGALCIGAVVVAVVLLMTRGGKK